MPEWAMVFMTLLWQRMNKIRLGRNMISDDAAAMPNLILFILCQSKVMNTMAHSGIK